MDPLTGGIREVQPDDPKVATLIERHLKLMWASSPSCSVHAMDAQALAEADARFFAMFHDDTPVAMGALKVLGGGHGELKSMHVVEAKRGQGLAGQILDHLIAVALDLGLGRVSLETGSQPVFEPARAFYRAHGFAECPPFAHYEPDPNSVFMTRDLRGQGCG